MAQLLGHSLAFIGKYTTGQVLGPAAIIGGGAITAYTGFKWFRKQANRGENRNTTRWKPKDHYWPQRSSASKLHTKAAFQTFGVKDNVRDSAQREKELHRAGMYEMRQAEAREKEAAEYRREYDRRKRDQELARDAWKHKNRSTGGRPVTEGWLNRAMNWAFRESNTQRPKASPSKNPPLPREYVQSHNRGAGGGGGKPPRRNDRRR